jgi:hypothetical protein
MKIISLVFISFFLCTAFSHLKAQNLENLKSSDQIKISGQLGVSAVFYDVQGRPANRPSFSWMIIGNPVVSAYGITLPFSFTVSEQQRDFQQPFNKIGVSPYYKWAKLHLGYRNVAFSKYTLGGHTILGAGGEFTPGKFRIGIMAGRLMKPIPINPAIPVPQTQEIPSYKRNGMAFKLGYGTADNYLDLILFRASDVTGSIGDTGQLVLPAANVVFSMVTHQKFLKQFVFDLEFANSVNTEDTRLNGDPGENLPPVYARLIEQNISTISSNAIETALGYDSKVFDLKLRFKQLDPGFRSLGTYFMQNNLRNITIEPTVSLAANKYIFGGSLGFQRDNLKKSLAHQTNRTIGSVRFTGNPVQWYRADLTYSNYDINQVAGLNPLDTLNKISQTTQSINLVQNFSLNGKRLSHNLLVSLNDQIMTDRNKNSGSSYKSLTTMGSYVIGYMPLRMNLSLTYTYCHVDLPGNNSRIYGPTVAYATALLKSSLSLSVAWSRFSNILNGASAGIISTYSINSTYKIKKKHVAKLRIYINDGALSTPYTETKAELGYAFIF